MSDNRITFRDIAMHMVSRAAKNFFSGPYFNEQGREGTTIHFWYKDEWFQVNINKPRLDGEDARRLLECSPNTCLDNYHKDRWYAAARVDKLSVRAWYKPHGNALAQSG